MNLKDITIALIKRIKENQDPKAKSELLQLYYDASFRWTKKTIKNTIYTDMIDVSDEEITSLIYQAFEQTIKNIRIEGNNNMSFKNFFYLMIRYQIYRELKETLNHNVIPHYEFICKIASREEKGNAHEGERKTVMNLDKEIAFEEILEFLRTKKPQYAEILMLKCQGFKNAEICQKMGYTEVSLKSRLQYIKKILRAKFPHMVENN